MNCEAYCLYYIGDGWWIMQVDDIVFTFGEPWPDAEEFEHVRQFHAGEYCWSRVAGCANHVDSNLGVWGPWKSGNR